MVFALYDECEEIWAGSPAVHCIEDEIQSSFSTPCSSEESMDRESCKDSHHDALALKEETWLEDANLESRYELSEKAPKDMALARRNLLSHLNEKKDSKLSKRTAADAQLLDMAREELKLKKAPLSSIQSSQEKHAATMQMFGEKLKNSTTVISNGFEMLQGILSHPTNNPNTFLQPQSLTYQTHNWGQSFFQPPASGESPALRPNATFQEILHDNDCQGSIHKVPIATFNKQ